MKLSRINFICICFGSTILSVTPAFADSLPLYQQRVEMASPDQQALDHAKKKLEEHKEVEIKEKFIIQPFHKQSGDLETSPNTFCRNCHGPLPHSKQLRTRAFNNMHVRFIACETCHFRPKDTELTFLWFDYEKKLQYQGESLFRLGKAIDNAEQRSSVLKIAPFYRGEPAFVMKDSAFSKSVAEKWKILADEDKILLRAKIHWPLEKKGLACQECHDENKSRLDVRALGATEQQFSAFSKHVIPQFFRRYKKDDDKITIRDMLH
jgi:DNA-directed RNA polymerase subunit M/transcription elongation factor TFIIS